MILIGTPAFEDRLLTSLGKIGKYSMIHLNCHARAIRLAIKSDT
jgi:hypothetical protein